MQGGDNCHVSVLDVRRNEFHYIETVFEIERAVIVLGDVASDSSEFVGTECLDVPPVDSDLSGVGVEK